MESLGEFIQNSKTIVNINICNNKITDNGIEILLPYLIGNEMLKRCDISFNRGITDNSVPLLVEIIKNSSIEDIIILRTSITNQNILVAPLIRNAFSKGFDKINMEGKYVIKINAS